MKTLGKKILGTLNLFAEWICYLILASLVLITVCQVFLRYVLNTPTSWSEEITLLLLIWFGMLSVAVATYQHKHMSISVVWDKLPASVQHLFNIFIDLLILIFAINIYFNADLLIEIVSNQKLPASEFSKAWLYYSLKMGGGLMVINSAGNVLLDRYSDSESSNPA